MGLGPSTTDENPEVEVLVPDAARTLRLPWLSRFSNASLSTHLVEHPGLSVWVPKTGEYVVGERWRRREDIANIVEVTARKGRTALVRALRDTVKSEGFRLLMIGDEAWRDQTKTYTDMGFGRIETIVFFRKSLKREDVEALAQRDLPQLTYRLLTLSDLHLLLRMDHSSFPWLWWNSEAEFEQYIQQPAVLIYGAWLDGQIAGYTSFTLYKGWAHLDRLAVTQGQQGRKLGAAQLVHALGVMVEHGSELVALSTQETNSRSHSLYRAFGFRQTNEKMHFYGQVLDPSVRLDFVEPA